MTGVDEGIRLWTLDLPDVRLFPGDVASESSDGATIHHGTYRPPFDINEVTSTPNITIAEGASYVTDWGKCDVLHKLKNQLSQDLSPPRSWSLFGPGHYGRPGSGTGRRAAQEWAAIAGQSTQLKEQSPFGTTVCLAE